MNKRRRKELSKAQDLLSQAKDIIEACAFEEREAFENMPEALQSSFQGERADEAAGNLEDASEALDELAGNLDDIIGKVDEAVEN